MRVLIFSLGIILFFCPQLFAFKSYKEIEIWEVEITRKDVRELIAENLIDVWSQTSTHATIKVDTEVKPILKSALQERKVEYTVSDFDLDGMIQSEHEWLHREGRIMNMSDYNSYDDIAAYLNDVATLNQFASLSSIGQSLEGRDLWVIKFSYGSGRPSVWIDCGIHAREWLTQSTCVWGVDLLDQEYGSNPDVTQLLDAYDVYILPVYNPDGYAFSWEGDRMWRKNRMQYPGDECIGIDLNRNFNNHFGGEGTSNDSCSEIFTGPSEESELETKAVAATILDLMENSDLTVMFSLHSYYQLWMYPYGWTTDPCADNDAIEAVAIAGMDALHSVYGTNYTQGSISNAIYVDSGSSTDWSYDVGLVQTHTLELRPDAGPGIISGGFVQEADQIYPTADETWVGIMAAIAAV